MGRVCNTPNILTISRVFLLPVIVYLFFTHSEISDILASFIFIFCCITDFLDGLLARVCKQTTTLGQILDPMADKALIVTTVFFMAAFHKISNATLIPACVILCREVIVSDVRDIVFAINASFTTSGVSKWKTAIQMFALSTVLIGDAFHTINIISIGEFLLWLSAILSIISAILYFVRYWNTLARL